MLNSNEYISLKTEEYGNSGTAYASLAGLLEAAIWLKYTEAETQEMLDRKCAETREALSVA